MMRPLKAVIIAASKKTGIKVKLESGLITTILTFEKKYRVGQTVSIAYDFTEKSPAIIIGSGYDSENIPEAQIKKRGGVDNDPEDPEINLWFSDTKYDL